MDDYDNVYDDHLRARSYSRLSFPGTYYLAFRDLPLLIDKYVEGREALDFGCGTGRSTRFLQALGFTATGVDISEPMLREARKLDPEGDYRFVGEKGLGGLGGDRFDLILSAFTFDNFPGLQERGKALAGLSSLLDGRGRIISIVSSPEIYVNEWVSFSTRDYPENRDAGSGDRVLIEILGVEDSRPVEDTICTDRDYLELYHGAGLSVLETDRPLAKGDEEIDWVNETEIPPWVIYVLGADSGPGETG
ncbi:MAG: methyltransferase domain-containing protein [Candidatus Latescibacteria bacterium]|nr:methyltransferase domain-containing protein [bacterium]MBD3423963.1 methyltransferase domain-containing protein [Candidatus Latescibacterota bacterium]